MSAPPVVLVVEDNAGFRHVLKEALASEGYEVLAARDEAEARELLREQRVDLMISDLTDPPQASRSLEELRQEFPNLPVVAMSGGIGGHPSLFFGAWQAPKGYRTLPKPFRLGELLAVSREVLGAIG
ncbi:MAG: response regulator [Gemmatimonadetes bacterium]|nr:response regulator [Gemmatimonadota bacterium]